LKKIKIIIKVKKVLFFDYVTMKTYTIIRDIIFFILWLAILWVGIYTAKMTDVIDSNLIYVNRKVPPMDKWQKLEWNFEPETLNPNKEIPEWILN
jgi:hypothetical protein